jgi:hypothetical protein
MSASVSTKRNPEPTLSLGKGEAELIRYTRRNNVTFLPTASSHLRAVLDA